MTKKSSSDSGSEPANAGPGAADELAGFDNLADRFLAQEAEESALTPRSVASSSVGARSGAAEEGRFAPPDAKAAPLSLEIDGTTRHQSTPEIALAAPPQQRAKSQWVTRDEPSGGWAKLAKGLLVVVLAAGGAAGYRFYTVGHILPQGADAAARLAIVAEPNTAEVLLDNRKLGKGVVSLDSGEKYSVVLSADGYLAMRSFFVPTAGQALRLNIRMGHKVPPLLENVAALPKRALEGVPKRTPEDISAGYEKLASLVGCGARLSGALQGALPALEDGEPSPVAYNLMDECRMVIEVQVAKPPAFPKLDNGTTALVTRILALNDALRDVQASAAANSKEKRNIRAAVRKASSAARKERRRWLTTMNQTKADWLREEASRTRSLEGASLHSVLRDVITASDAWSRAALSAPNKAGELRKTLVAAVAVAKSDATMRKELYAVSGADGFLLAVEKLVGDEALGQVFELHNTAVKRFNGVVLPIRFDATP